MDQQGLSLIAKATCLLSFLMSNPTCDLRSVYFRGVYNADGVNLTVQDGVGEDTV